MRRLIAVLLLALPLWSVEWLHNWDKALAQSKTQNKPVLVVLMRPDCPYCQKLSSQTLASAPIEQTITRGFVPLYLDTERHGDQIARSGLQAQGVPASFIVDSNGRVQAKLMGYQPPMVYMGFLQQGL